MTPDQLDVIEKLAEAATPGPWRAQLSDKGHALFGPLPNGECGSMRIALSSYAAFDRANMLFAEAMRDATLPLVKALREAWAALEWQAAMTKALSESQERLAQEVKEARAEVERLKAKLMEEARWVYDTGQRTKDALSEVERLRATLERMKAEKDFAKIELDAAIRNIARLLAAVDAWEKKAEQHGWTP